MTIRTAPARLVTTLGLLAAVSGLGVVAAPAAAAIEVGDEAELRAAFADPAETEIVVTTDIDLADCAEGDLDRDSATDLVVRSTFGQGPFTITQTCDDERVLDVEFSGGAAGALTIDSMTLAHTADPVDFSGGAISSEGDVHAVDSTINGFTAALSGGAIVTIGDVTITNSTLNGNTATNDADARGGAILADNVTIIGSTLNDNTAISDEDAFGGAIDAGNVTITDSTVSHNMASAEDRAFGGAIEANAVTITGSTLDDNTATGELVGGGGAIFIGDGDVTIAGAVLRDNTASGIDTIAGAGLGGAVAANSVTVTGSTFDGNGAFGGGEAVGGAITAVDVTVVGSTLSGNVAEVTATSLGGAIRVDADATIVNSTLTANSAGAGGGLVAGNLGGQVRLLYATVVDNSGADGANVLLQDPGPTPLTLEVQASVVGRPDGGDNCLVPNSADVSGSFNWLDDMTCGAPDDGINVLDGVDPALGELADNGGGTRTLLPLAGGPLVNAIPSGDCLADPDVDLTSDQRGIDRPQGGGCDMGAVELQLPLPATNALTADPIESEEGDGVTLTAMVNAANPDHLVVPGGDVEFFVDGVSMGTTTIASPATLDVAGLASGDHEIVAQYGGDTWFAPATSNLVTITVTAAQIDDELEELPMVGAGPLPGLLVLAVALLAAGAAVTARTPRRRTGPTRPS